MIHLSGTDILPLLKFLPNLLLLLYLPTPNSNSLTRSLVQKGLETPRKQKKIATTFTLFPNLPTELWLQIWRVALPLFPRILHVRSTHNYDLRRDCVIAGPWMVVPNTIPILLSVNQEARTELLPFYNIPFSPRKARTSRFNPRFNRITDMLFIHPGESCPFGHTLSDLLKSIFGRRSFNLLKTELRTLAVSRTFSPFCVSLHRSQLVEDLNEFTNLKELLCVMNRGLNYGEVKILRIEEYVPTGPLEF